jgi:hypothetical protein
MREQNGGEEALSDKRADRGRALHWKRRAGIGVNKAKGRQKAKRYLG